MNKAPKLHQRIIVTAGPAKGVVGTVCRMLMRREPASHVALDHRVDEVCSFPPDAGDRATHALIQWEDMEPAP